ncbi:MAG: sulfite exporter TauE/SafE family protein, partial [Oscillospiraceae bacterium]
KIVIKAWCRMKEKVKMVFAGAVSGLLNGLFGSGGGLVAVMFLRSMIGDEQKAHASATLMILIMSLVSFALYLSGGFVEISEGIVFLPGGVVGAILGAAFLKNISSDVLRRVFGGAIALSGAIMLFR